ncbi:MAG: hypothetical protein DMF53_28665 [Acidobacteria bacterium]|nr:MAG: hypothetical protein DMF53_28665 [Acidobacteriota bacterium]
MAITDPILLSPDVILVPVADLPEEVRRRLDPNEGDWAITHPRARTPSRLLDAASASLLAELKTPRTIVDAVIRYSQARDLDPESTLVEAYPLLERLLAAGFLVSEGSDEAGGIAPSLKPGDRIAGFEVLEHVQVLEDTELHLVQNEHGAAALKIERPAARGKNREAFEREAAVLERLRSRPLPPGIEIPGYLRPPLAGASKEVPYACWRSAGPCSPPTPGCTSGG